MPLHLEPLDLSGDLEHATSVLIVSCPVCPPVSLAIQRGSPLMEVFKNGLKTGGLRGLHQGHQTATRATWHSNGRLLDVCAATDDVPLDPRTARASSETSLGLRDGACSGMRLCNPYGATSSRRNAVPGHTGNAPHRDHERNGRVPIADDPDARRQGSGGCRRGSRPPSIKRFELTPDSSLQTIRCTALAAGTLPQRWRSALLGAGARPVRWAAWRRP